MENLLRVKDIDEAAYLWCAGYDMERASSETRSDGKVVIFFEFSNPKKMHTDKVRKEFYNRSARVEPKEYSARLDDIRTILHTHLREIKR